MKNSKVSSKKIVFGLFSIVILIVFAMQFFLTKENVIISVPVDQVDSLSIEMPIDSLQIKVGNNCQKVGN